MIETTQDILYLMLAISVGVFTIFLVWMLGEVAMMLRNMNRFIRELHCTIGKIEDALSGIRKKVEHSASHLSLLAEGAKQLIRMFVESKTKKAKPKK